jgi:signal transduction histidine kinase/CHASE3 domain sensor protein
MNDPEPGSGMETPRRGRLLQVMDSDQENRFIKAIAITSVLLVVALLGFAYSNLARYKEENEAIRRSHQIMHATDRFFMHMKEAESGCRGFLITGDSVYLEPYRRALPKLDITLSELLELLPDTEFVSKPLGIKVVLRQKQANWKQLITDQRTGRMPPGQPDPEVMRKGEQLTAQFEEIHADLLKRHGEALQHRRAQERSLGLVTPMMILIYALLALLGVGLLFFRLIRTLERVQQAERTARLTARERDKEARTRELAERSLKRVLDSSPSGIMAFRSLRDDKGEISDFEWMQVNHAGCELAKAPAQELLGAKLSEKMPGVLKEGLFESFKQVVESGEPLHLEYMMEQDGHRVWFNISAVRLLDGFVVTFLDITETRSQQQIIQESERLAVTGKFARLIAHEVRNPLTNIQLALEQLEVEYPADEDGGSGLYIDILKRNATRISTLITQMLHSSRPMEMVLEPGSMNAVLRKAYELVKDRCELESMECQLDLGEDLPFVRMDKETLTIAFVNLFINATEAMESGRGQLKVSSAEIGGRVRVMISDNGKGLSAEDKARIFQPFFSGRKGGMGLGLTESRNILNAHNALLSVESEQGSGTSFIIHFNAV